MLAAAKGHADAVQVLLDAGADRYAEVRDHANLMNVSPLLPTAEPFSVSVSHCLAAGIV